MTAEPADFFARILADFDQSEPFVIGFSGGGDSTALLARLVKIAKRNARPVHALIVNHRMKPGANAEAERAAKLAHSLGAQVQILPWLGTPLVGHASARHARFSLLADALHALHTHRLLLAHTCDDQSETFLLRLAAGSGPHGLAAMGVDAPYPLWPEGFGLRVCRPLLKTSRAQLREELRQAQISWIEDPANADRRYARVQLRDQLADLQAAGFSLKSTERAMAQFQNLHRDEQVQLEPLVTDHVGFSPFGFAWVHTNITRIVCGTTLARLFEQVILGVSGAQRCKHRGVKLVERWQRVIETGRACAVNGCVLRRKDQQVFVYRDPGAVCGRDGRPPLTVPISAFMEPVWFDNRWLIRTPELGVLMPLGVCGGSMGAAQRSALALVPAFARKTLPVLCTPDGKKQVLPVSAPKSILFAGAQRGLETGTIFA